MKICICGACGKMGKEVARTIHNQKDMELTLAIDQINLGEDINFIAGINNKKKIIIKNDLKKEILNLKPEVMIELTSSKSVFKNTKIALDLNIPTVIGATGLKKEELNILKEISNKKKVGVLLVPNFSIGAILMMRFAEEASKYFKNAEIIEYHHEKKIDSPSGTSIATAELIQKNKNKFIQENNQEYETLKGARGADFNGLKIHSIRLPGFIAHQEIIFGNNGELLKLHHDSMNRESFMSGVILAIKIVRNEKKFNKGLDKFI